MGRVSLKEGVDMISAAIAFCGENRILRLLVDVRGLTGYRFPETMDRYTMSAQFAAVARPGQRVVLVAPAEVIDPQRFGITVATNRGLEANIFSSEPEAISWLLAT